MKFNPLDSVFVPFLRGGVGWYDDIAEGGRGVPDYPFIISLGAGGMYLAGSRMFFRAELNYRTHQSVSGSNTRLKIDWTAVTLIAGIGFRL